MFNVVTGCCTTISVCCVAHCIVRLVYQQYGSAIRYAESLTGDSAGKDDGPAFFKEGNGGTWRNYNINFPRKGISVIIMANSENGEKIFQELLETIAGKTCIPWKWQGYEPYDAVKPK